jgi:hypothetical protein
VVISPSTEILAYLESFSNSETLVGISGISIEEIAEQSCSTFTASERSVPEAMFFIYSP